MKTRAVFPAALAALMALEICLGAGTRQETAGVDKVETPGPPSSLEAALEERQAWTTAVDPRPLGESARKGLEWLLQTQHESGGWGQGEESVQMRGSTDDADGANVADTCLAALALFRSEANLDEGLRAAALRRAIAFVCGEIEASDQDSLFVTDIRGTRVQAKIGTYIDTFMASMLLAEVRASLPEEELSARVDAALAKVLHKIERNQRNDGGWDNHGWAPVLALSMAGKGINRAAQTGFDVSRKLLDASDDYFLGAAAETGPGAAGAGAAGVVLYSSAANLGALQDLVNTGATRERELRDQADNATEEGAREKARAELERIASSREAHAQVQQSVIDRLDDPSFVAGFGSNGGEEFLSYMNISESLVVKGGNDWLKWDQAMAQNLSRVQNQDGSWTGHHCITGRTFCTSAALLVLMGDRTPVPAEASGE